MQDDGTSLVHQEAHGPGRLQAGVQRRDECLRSDECVSEGGTLLLTDQVRRSSRSAAANIAEAWRKRRYEAAFISKLNDSEAEAAETQVWIQFAVNCAYIDASVARGIYKDYDRILGMLVRMIDDADKWTRMG
jgi:four helix bundle protein